MDLRSVGDLVAGGLIGGALTGLGSIFLLRDQMTALKNKVANIEATCTGCKANAGDIERTLEEHIADEERHVTRASSQILADILLRVTRIESRLMNGPFKNLLKEGS